MATSAKTIEYAGLGVYLQQKGNEVIQALRNNLELVNSIATRNLIASIQVKVIISGNVFTWELLMADYWKYVEHGRKAGKMPPIDSIMKWITDKGIEVPLDPFLKKAISSLKNKKIKKALSRHTKEVMRKKMAFGIARKIAKKGTKPTGFYSDVINHEWVEKLKTDISKALKKDYTIQILNAAA